MKTKGTSIAAVALAILLVAFLGLQGLPYFISGEESVSIAGYLAFPTDHTSTTEYLAGQIEGYNINSIVGGPILLQVAAIALIFLLLRFRNNIAVFAGAGIWGLGGLLVYGFNTALRLGGGARFAYMGIFTVVLAVSVACVIKLAQGLRSPKEEAEKAMTQAHAAR